MERAKIRVEHLDYWYGQGTPFAKKALDDVSLEIGEGELVGIIGHTGSGKSTLIQHFNGLMKPDSGKVYIDGKDIWAAKGDLRKIRFQVGLVFQYPEYQLFEETVFQDVAFGPKNMGLSEGKIRENVTAALRFVGLSEELMNQSPFELSGGQKRRVAIAGVMAMEPEILILDEPTAGLDPRGRDEILGRLEEYHRARGTTVLLVSHSMEDVARIADRILVMNQAKVARFGTVPEVFRDAAYLEQIGLSIPQITAVFLELSKRGYKVNPAVYTVEQAVAEIARLRREGGSAPC